MAQNLQKRKVQVVVVCTMFNKLWLLLLRVNKDRGGFWQNVTGSVEKNENFKNGGARELWEETYLDTSAGHWVDLNLTHNFIDQYNRAVEEKSFAIYFPTIPPIRLSKEHDLGRWIEINSLTEAHFLHYSNFEAASKAIDQIKSLGLLSIPTREKGGRL